MSDRLQITIAENVTVASLEDERLIDEIQIQELGKALSGTLAADACEKLLVSFAKVKFMSSSSLNQLISLDREAKSQNKPLKLCDICPEIMEVFQITALDSVFDIVESVDAGVASFGA